jgi:hypothetical protein
MKANPEFIDEDKEFWASVRSISEFTGYSARNKSRVSSPIITDIHNSFLNIGADQRAIADSSSDLSNLSRKLSRYLDFRANILNDYVEPRLMDVDRARDIFTDLRKRINPKCPIPMNKQSGNKKAPAYMTGIVNMLIEANSNGKPCDYDPRGLTCFTKNGLPLRTLARRVDGAFTSTINPIAIWEIKEYYYTTTFGSRVADGIYETLLDGMEIEELRHNEGIEVFHYLFVDSHYTWWKCGRSYLCRIIDMIHMGFIDEALFGFEVVERLPEIVNFWLSRIKQ